MNNALAYHFSHPAFCSKLFSDLTLYGLNTTVLFLFPVDRWIGSKEKRREEKRREGNNFPIIIPITPKKYSLLNSSCGKNTISRQNQYEQKINFDFANFSHFNL